MALVVGGIFVLGAAVTVLGAYFLFDDASHAARERVDANMKVAWDVLLQKGKAARVVEGKLLVGDYVVNDSFDVVDKVKQMVGGTCTVFMGDLRVSTNVKKADGSRAIGTTLAKTAAYKAIFEQKTSFRGEVEILGEPYMTAYDPILDEGGNVIGILFVGMKKAEFTQAAVTTVWTTASVTLSVMIMAMAVCYVLVRRGVVLPLKRSISVMGQLARGDLSVEIPTAASVIEIEEILEALGIFKANAADRQRLAAEQKAEQDLRNNRQSAMEQLTRDFNEGVRGVLSSVTGSARELSEAARSMSHIAEDTLQQTTVVAAAAEQASVNVETVAAAAEELVASENEIARQIERSHGVASMATEKAERVNRIVASLSTATSHIGDVMTLIKNIASQTNLLALNATIEAARAGDAGKGFAVVAGEVKNLANQTARATEDINGQIGAVQAATREAVEAISEINSTICEISESIAAIASAVEQQAAATAEIARNVQEASSGTKEVTSNITLVKDGASSTGASAQEVLTTAVSLSKQSDELSAEVADFLSAIKSVSDRRQYERIHVHLSASIKVDGRATSVTVKDISLGGVRVEPGIGMPNGSAVVFEMQGWPSIKARIIGSESNYSRFQFALDAATQSHLKEALNRLVA